MDDIVRSCLPDEQIPFDLSGEQLISQLFANESSRGDPSGADFHFLPEAKSVLEFVLLLHATYKMAGELSGNKTAAEGTLPDATTLKDLWERTLILAGLSKGKALEIVTRFGNSFRSLLETDDVDKQ